MDADQRKRARSRALNRVSPGLGAWLEADVSAAEVLGAGALPDREERLEGLAGARAESGLPGLRRAKRRALADIAARDLAGELSLEEVGAALSDLADSCLEVALEPNNGEIAVIAMGKLGAGELNYVSDIDLMFVSEGEPGRASDVAETLLRSLGAFAPEGRSYEIDLNLRPEGRNGPLVRSLAGYLEYYRRWAKPWEFQALLKARAAAGNREVGRRFVEATQSFVFPSEVSPERISAIRAIKERVEAQAAHVARGSNFEDVKLGAGGIRDIEFSVQLLQLVHGPADPSLRMSATLAALAALVDGGYVAEEDGAGLSVAYRWLRAVEHRLQLFQERRVRHLPQDRDARARLARSMGFRDSPVASGVSRFEQAHRAVLADVRSRFEKLFYRPMIESLAAATAPRLSSNALEERLLFLGFRDVKRASDTLAGLVSGTSRRAKLYRILTPAFLKFLASTPMPDQGLISFLRLGEALGDRLDTLGALRDNPPGLELLAQSLGGGRVVGELLEQVPEELYTIAQGQITTDRGSRGLLQEATAFLGWREPGQRLDGLRRFKRRELVRIALADLAGGISVAEVGARLSEVAEACLGVSVAEAGVPFAVIGMGRLGGCELNYSSDIDVMFIHDGSSREAERAAEHVLKALGEITPEGQAFRVDVGLRPEGRAGPLVRSFDSYMDYYERWARPWESQALLKARPVAGDDELANRLVSATRLHAYPERLSEAALSEIRHLKIRMEKERVKRRTDARRDLKLGPGGLADVEFAVQLLQLRHAYAVEELRVSSTVAALSAARSTGLLSEQASQRLLEANELLLRLRNRLFLMLGRPTDAVPTKPEFVEALGLAMGYRDQPRQELEEAYLRVTRRCRKVAEEIIFG